MEHLKDIFYRDLIASIDDSGKVIIGEYAFTPAYILQEVEPEGFDQYFSDWCENRRIEMLNKGEQILGLFDNRERFSALKTAFKRSAVIPFIGAGLSVSSGYPGWTKFLSNLRNETRIQSEELDSLLRSGQYEEAAQRIADDMPGASFDEAIENVFGKDRQIDGPVQMLPYLFDSGVVTTNFDNVLKRCFEAAGKPFTEILLGEHAIDLPKSLGKEERVLVKLHGKANSRRGRVLTNLEYQAHYEGEIRLIDVIASAATKTLLFIGCSLTTDRTFLALSEILRSNGIDRSVRHYALVPYIDGEDRLARRDLLVTANIFPIWYKEEDGHDLCIEAIFYMLLADES